MEDVKLEGAHHAHDDLLHAGIGELKNLNGALQGDLFRSLQELFPLHGVHRAHPGKVLWGKGGDGVKAKFLPRGAQGVSDGEDTRVKHTDDVSGIGLLNDLPLGGHELLGTGEAELFLALDVVDLLLRVKPAGADPEKGDSVPVGFIHVGLNFEDEGGEEVLHGVNFPLAAVPGQRRGGHTEEVL